MKRIKNLKRKPLSELYNQNDKCEIFLLTNYCILFFYRLPCSPEEVGPQKETKYFVFFSCLMQLFQLCPMCQQPAAAEVSRVVGTLIHITQKCHNCSYSRVWCSQPYIKKMPAGNLLLSAAILFSGSMISQTLRIFKILKTECFSRVTFHKHQRNYLIPVVINKWKEEQEHVIQSLSLFKGGMVLSGDGRSDSPGHCARYGAFTVIMCE